MNRTRGVRKTDAVREARIGAKKSISFNASVDAIRAPFDERLQAFLDFLYSDGERRPGVVSKRYAEVLFHRWVNLSLAYDPAQSEYHAYWRAVARAYLDPKSLTRRDRSGDSLGRKAAEEAMRAPFERILLAYIERVFDPVRPPGIRDEAHALDTFVTFAGLLHACEGAHGIE